MFPEEEEEEGQAGNKRERIGEVRAQSSPQQLLLSPCLNVVDTMQGQDWSLCDEDCGWYGRCAGEYDYHDVQTD